MPLPDDDSTYNYSVEFMGLTGSYPDTPVHTRLCSYDIICGVPLIIELAPPNQTRRYARAWDDTDGPFAPSVELLKVAMWLCFPTFPMFMFDEQPPDSMLARSPCLLGWRAVEAVIQRVFSDATGELAVRNPSNGYRRQMLDTGVSTVHLAGASSSMDTLVEIWSHDDQQTGADIASRARLHALFRHDIHIPEKLAKRYFGLLSSSPRLVQVAAHYYARACSLVNQGFAEEAGLSLYLVYETIMKDFELLHGLHGKKQSLKRLKRDVRLPASQYSWLDELRDARSRLLAHPDYWMFTCHEGVNDPDSYCYDHFDAISLLLLRYAHYRHRNPGEVELPEPYD
jgi:hypothetical protein